jgi:hypothetical protein
VSSEEWGPAEVYCVPALVNTALLKITGQAPGVETLARDLGVKVRSQEEDSWNLGVASSPALAGIGRDDAQLRIPLWLLAHANHVTFEYTPLAVIVNRDAEGFCQEALERGWIVGASVNWSKLVGGQHEARHVIQVLQYSSQEVITFDPTAKHDENKSHDPQRFESAMFDVNGGFWIFKRTN